MKICKNNILQPII